MFFVHVDQSDYLPYTQRWTSRIQIVSFWWLFDLRRRIIFSMSDPGCERRERKTGLARTGGGGLPPQYWKIFDFAQQNWKFFSAFYDFHGTFDQISMVSPPPILKNGRLPPPKVGASRQPWRKRLHFSYAENSHAGLCVYIAAFSSFQRHSPYISSSTSIYNVGHPGPLLSIHIHKDHQ